MGEMDILLGFVSAITGAEKTPPRMTKTQIFFIIIISMRVKQFSGSVQLFSLKFFSLLCLLVFPAFFSGCDRSSEERPVMPPATHPLAREYIGFGVVNVSFTHILSEPGTAGVSQAYLRRGTVVRVIERRQINSRTGSELWVLAEGNYQGSGSVSRGWLQEATLEIYESEMQANTASRSLSQ